MSDKPPPAPGRWPPATIIALVLAVVTVGTPVVLIAWNRGIEQGKADERSQHDPTVVLRAEMQALGVALAEVRQQLIGFHELSARVRQAEADIARVHRDGNERDAGQDRLLELLRGGLAEQRERVAVIERTSSIPLPGPRR